MDRPKSGTDNVTRSIEVLAKALGSMLEEREKDGLEKDSVYGDVLEYARYS